MKALKKNFTNNQPPLCSAEINLDESINHAEYPFCLPIIQSTKEIVFDHPVTFFVGENGAGKSTILESISHNIGLGPEGGSKNINFSTTSSTASALGECMKLSWNYKPQDAYFFRAESFFNVANYLEGIAKDDYRAYSSYGNKSLHHQSHGESFFAFFSNRLGDSGIYILDEPESALSPQRQLALLRIIYNLTKQNTGQFIIATHSPILLAYPNATIYSCDNDVLQKIKYEDTAHYQITKQFLNNTELYLKNLLSE